MTIKSTVSLFLALCMFRSLNTFLIQSYFDPDEFWQSLEPAYCEVFGNHTTSAADGADPFACTGYTWEWRRRAEDPASSWLEVSMKGPIRSYFSVLPVYLFYKVLRVTRCDSHFMVSQGPKLLYAALVAAPTDLSVWIMARWLSLGSIAKEKRFSSGKIPTLLSENNNDLPSWCLLCSVTSWFHAYTLTRTFSNSLETMLLAVSMALVSPEFLGRFEGVPGVARRQACCFFLGGLSISLRFTSVLAWIPMGLILALQSRGTWTQRAAFLIRTCAVFGILGITAAAIVDRLWYGFWAIPFLGSFHFNVVLGNATLYGSHPWHWYLTAGIPLITGLLFPLVVWDLFTAIFGWALDARCNVWIVIVVFTFFHCCSGHKEFRFLLPILPLFCLLAGSNARALTASVTGHRKQSRGWQPQANILVALIVMAVPNILAVLYLGLFHQSAPISVNHKIARMVAVRSDTLHIDHNKAEHPSIFSVHYLTGGCHSTPLHSYLHVRDRTVVWDTWSLDCSPSCRSDPDILCESERFRKDPAGFVEAAYGSSEDASCVSDRGISDQIITTCAAPVSSRSGELPAPRVKRLPDFAVTFAEFTAKLQPQLSALGLMEVARFPQGINGLRMGTLIQTGDGYPEGDGAFSMYRRVALLGDFLEITMDEMVLYASSTFL